MRPADVAGVVDGSVLSGDHPDAGRFQLFLGFHLVEIRAGDQVPATWLDRPPERLHFGKQHRELPQAVAERFAEGQHRRTGGGGLPIWTLPPLSMGACCRPITQTPAASSCSWASISSRSVLATRSQRRGLIDHPSASILESNTESFRRR